jgi:predicted GIY-YIG superfamily endonuclease
MLFVYVLHCSDGSYYVGLTEDVIERLEVHQSGKGPKYTARRLPVELVYQESFATLEEAVRRERQLKGWSRAKKLALISKNLGQLKALAACRDTREAQVSGTLIRSRMPAKHEGT